MTGSLITDGVTSPWATLYQDNVRAVAELARGLTDDQVRTTVPATPAWTVREVLAHVAGGPADSLAGRMDGAPGPEWTARHVAERAGRSVEELVSELEANTPAVMAAQVAEPRPAQVWDLAVHHADLHEALGLGRLPERYWEPIVPVLAPLMLASRLERMADVPAYELFRGLFSRRSRQQLEAWKTGLEPEALDNMCVFGPREDDQPVP